MTRDLFGAAGASGHCAPASPVRRGRPARRLHFQTEMPDEVCRTPDLIEYIRSIDTRIFSDAQINEICDRIRSARLKPTRQVNRDHVENLKRRRPK